MGVLLEKAELEKKVEMLTLRFNNMTTPLATTIHTNYGHGNILETGVNGIAKTYMLFVGWEVGIVKNFWIKNAARDLQPRAAFSRPRSQFFTIRTDPKPANNTVIVILR